MCKYKQVQMTVWHTALIGPADSERSPSWRTAVDLPTRNCENKGTEVLYER